LRGGGQKTSFNGIVDGFENTRHSLAGPAHTSAGTFSTRIGARRGVEIMDNVRAGLRVQASLDLLGDLCETMTDGSLCALGGLTPLPVLSALKHFPEDFQPARAAE